VLQFCRSLGCLISTGVAVNRNGFESPPVVPGTALVGLVIPALRILYDYSWFRRLCCFVRRLLLSMKSHRLIPETSRIRR
jgi:hypothetical protein